MCSLTADGCMYTLLYHTHTHTHYSRADDLPSFIIQRQYRHTQRETSSFTCREMSVSTFIHSQCSSGREKHSDRRVTPAQEDEDEVSLLGVFTGPLDPVCFMNNRKACFPPALCSLVCGWTLLSLETRGIRKALFHTDMYVDLGHS